MKKGKRLIKKAISLLLVLLFSINSFAAIVSDNDGSAFITKAEFDSLKNDFQAQIDNYNTSIDSKIDGAIAAYLAGIRLAKESQVNILNYVKDGVYAPRKMDDIKWSEGDISFYGWAVTTNFTSSTSFEGNGTGKWTFNGGTKNNFKELLVSDVDYTNGKAIWNGWAWTKLGISLSGYSWDSQTMNTGFKNSPDYVTLSGFLRKSNTKISVDDNKIIMIKMAAGQSKYDYALYTSSINIFGKNALLDRTIVNEKYYCKDIISVPKENRIFGFTNVDEFRDWCNDWVKLYDQTEKQKQLTHTAVKRYTGVGSGSGAVKMEASNGRFTEYSVSVSEYEKDFDFFNGYASTEEFKENDTYLGLYKPYVGFVQTIDEWKDLCTTAYDGVIDDLLETHSDLNYIITKSGDKHLSVAAGFPFIYAKKEQKISIPIDFKDNTKPDFDLWFKVGSFSNDEEVTDANLKDIIKNIKGKNIVASTRTNAVRLKGGKGTVEFEMPKNGYIFFKWSLASSTTLGGGTFYPEKTVKVTDS